jgi:hypothetical protein
MNPESDWFTAYPQGEERVKINKAFDKLFEEYKKQYGEKKYDEKAPRVKYQSGETVIETIKLPTLMPTERINGEKTLADIKYTG